MIYVEHSEKNLDGKMSFKPDEVEDGKLKRFIQSLMEMNSEIHLWTDGYVWVVEYIQDINAESGVQFVAIDTTCEQVVSETENK